MDTMINSDRGIGDNQPTHFDKMKSRVEALVETANKWIIDVPEITTEDQADRAKDFREQLRKMRTAVENERKGATLPLRNELSEINDQFKGLEPYLTKSFDHLSGILEPYLDKLDHAKKERERLAREKSEAKQREADELARKAAENTGDIIQNEVAAERAQESANSAQKDATNIAREKPQIQGEYSQRAVGFRTSWHAEITDINAALKHYQDHPKISELLIQLANADARVGRRRIPGFKIEQKRKVN